MLRPFRAPGGGDDGEVDFLSEECGGEDDVDGGAEPRVGEEEGAGVEDEGRQAAEATKGHEQVDGGRAPLRVAAITTRGFWIGPRLREHVNGYFII